MTVSRARRLSSSKPTQERSAIGSSRWRRASSSRSGWSSAEVSSSWWSVPRRSATRRASGSSLALASSTKPTEKVCTGRSETSAISAVIRLESRPPLSITPSGTSLTIRARVALRSSSSRRSPSSCQERADALRWRVPGAPVLALLGDPAVAVDEVGGGIELAHALEQGQRARHVAPGHEQLGRGGVEARPHQARRDQRLDLGGEGQPGLGLGEVERLYAHAVAGEDQAAARAVPEGDREHPAQALDEARARAPRRGGRSSRRRRWWRSGGRAPAVPRAARGSCRSRR